MVLGVRNALVAPAGAKLFFLKGDLVDKRRTFCASRHDQGLTLALDLRVRSLLFLVCTFLCLHKNPNEAALGGLSGCLTEESGRATIRPFGLDRSV